MFLIMFSSKADKKLAKFSMFLTMFVQAHADKKLGKTMYLPLAEKMTQKYLQEKEFEAEGK